MTREQFEAKHKEVLNQGLDITSAAALIDEKAPRLLDAVIAVVLLKEEGVDMDDWECWLAPYFWPNEPPATVNSDFLGDLLNKLTNDEEKSIKEVDKREETDNQLHSY